MDHSDKYTPQGINSVRNLRFDNTVDRVCLWNCGPSCTYNSWIPNPNPYGSHVTMSSKMDSIWDFDGSLLGTGEPTILGQ
jgi:hypothetical protein